MRFASALSLLLIVLVGCSQPYVKPVVENPRGVQIAGINTLLLTGQDVHLISIHGMCTHVAQGKAPDNWVLDRVELVERQVNAKAEQKEIRRIENSSGTASAEIHLYSYALPKGNLTHALIVWSPLTQERKRGLAFDSESSNQNGGEFAWTRASLNGELKTGLINDCLADAVIYAGEEFYALHQVIKKAICLAFGGQYSEVGCITEVADQRKLPQIVFASESLGSKMLFDGLLALILETTPQHQRNLLEHLSGNIRVYMLANQLPILDLARGPGASAERRVESTEAVVSSIENNSLQRLLEVLLRRPAIESIDSPQTESVSLVAFTDPNDLLSYRLPKRYEDTVPGRINVLNVIVSNDKTYLGYVERPDTAHSGYRDNAAVMTVMFCGIGLTHCLDSNISTGAKK